MYKKAGLTCAAAVTAAVLSVVPISVELGNVRHRGIC
jgi:hypothetical protein